MSYSPTETRPERERGPGAGPEAGLIEVAMPRMGVSVAEGTIVGWMKRVGERVEADEPICEVSTDKIDVEIPAPGSGVLDSVLVEAGQTAAVGTVLGLIGPGEEASGPGADGAVADRREDEGRPGGVSEEAEIDRSSFISPVVRRIADRHGVDLTGVRGHGVGGRIRKVDLLEHLEDHGQRNGGPGTEPAAANGHHERPLHSESPYREPASDPASPPAPREALAALQGPSRRVAMDPMRSAIARHMLDSRRSAAHCTTVVEADFGAVVVRRSELKGELAERGVPLTYLAFVATAAVAALAEFPILNASVEGEEIVHHDDVNLGIAVALEEGLIVPVIRRAQHLSLEGMAAAIDRLAGAARRGELSPDDVTGGTFTITNPGQFGAMIATPIINQPQVAILDLEAIVRRPVVVDGPGGEAIAIRPISYLCMSWDHRATDGAVAARFMARVRELIERGGQR